MSYQLTIIIFTITLYVHLIYPDELEIKDTTESDKYASYSDILLNIDSNGRVTTTLYDKSDDFAIVNFTFLCSNVPLSPAYGVYVSVDSIKLMLQGYDESRLKLTRIIQALPSPVLSDCS